MVEELRWFELVSSMDQKMLAEVLGPLIQLAFSSGSSENQTALRRFATRSLEDTSRNLVQLVAYQPSFAISDESAILDDLDGQLQTYIPLLFSASVPQRSLLFRLLATTALARGEQRALEVLALLLFSVTQASLGVFVAAAAYLLPFFPDSLGNLLCRLSALRAAFPEEESQGRWLQNLVSLVRQERQASETEPVRDLRLCFQLSVHFGVWLPELVDYALAEGLGSEEAGKQRREELVALVELVGVPSPMLPALLTRSLDSLLRLFFRLLSLAQRTIRAVLVEYRDSWLMFQQRTVRDWRR